MRWGQTLWTLFQTRFGVLSGPGAHKGEDQPSSLKISEAVSSGATLKRRRKVGPQAVGLPGKKFSIRAVFSSSSVDTRGRP